MKGKVNWARKEKSECIEFLKLGSLGSAVQPQWSQSDTVVYGQESPGWIKLFKHVTFLFENFQKPKFVLLKLIGQWIPDGEGLRIARDIKKIFSFLNSTKNTVTKLGQFTKLGPFYKSFSFLNCPNFVTIFCRILKTNIFFQNRFGYTPPFCRREFTDQSILSKIEVSGY